MTKSIIRRLHALPIAVCLAAATVPNLIACEAIKKARQLFHPNEADGSDPANLLAGLARLRIEVEPAEGIAISINGRVVSTHSPFADDAMRPGQYIIKIEAPGYYSFSLPVTLQPEQMLTIPLALRPEIPQQQQQQQQP